MNIQRVKQGSKITLYNGVYMMLLGIFFGSEGFDLSHKHWKDSWTLQFFTAFMILGVLLIFFHAVPLESGESLLEWFYEFMANNWDNEAVGAIILLGVIALFMWGITESNNQIQKTGDSE